MPKSEAIIRYGGIQIPLSRWNEFVRQPQELGQLIEKLRSLYIKLVEQQAVYRGEQGRIRE